MNSGLYALAGASATATAAACANLLLDPITKVSKVYFGFNLVRVGLAIALPDSPPPPARPAPLATPAEPARPGRRSDWWPFSPGRSDPMRSDPMPGPTPAPRAGPRPWPF